MPTKKYPKATDDDVEGHKLTLRAADDDVEGHKLHEVPAGRR